MAFLRTMLSLLVLASWGVAICAGPGKTTIPRQSRERAVATNEVALENLQRVSERIYCGAEPKTDKAFEDLARMGIRTVVSVDGIRPDIESSKLHGMRYVHIPIGYDGVDKKSRGMLTRLVREAEALSLIHI